MNSDVPYDITAIPYFAYTPSSVVWLLVFLLFLLAIRFVTYRRSAKNNSTHESDVHATQTQVLTYLKQQLDELQNISPDDDATAFLFRVTLTLRRYLSVVFRTDCACMSLNELSQHVLVNSTQGSIGQLLGTAIIRLEERKYLPNKIDRQDLIAALTHTISIIAQETHAVRGHV